MTKVNRCTVCFTINGDFHNGCQCDYCDGYVIQDNVSKEEMPKYLAKWEKEKAKWDKEHTIIVKQNQKNKEVNDNV